MITPVFDQDAVNRYISSRVIDKLDPSPSKAEGLELPYTKQDIFIRNFLAKHYPVGSTYSEFPMWIDQYCNTAIEMCQSKVELHTASNAYLSVNTPMLFKAERLMNDICDNARIAGTLAAYEIDPIGYFSKQISEIEVVFNNHIAYLRSRFDLEKKHYPSKSKKMLSAKIETAAEQYLSEFMANCQSVCIELKGLISAQ